ncbi:MAG: site-specific integrase [Chloroflexi bacterium]|nr:site-specific integrase [Chloroflexota bacterium]
MKGSVSPRGKNVWRIRYDLPTTDPSVRKQATETVHGPKHIAEKVLRERLASLEAGTHVEKSKETLAQFMQSWLDNYAVTHCQPRTVMGYRTHIKLYIVPLLGHVPIQSLTPRHIQDFHAQMLSSGLSKRTVLHAHRVLSEALKHAMSWGILARNPVQAVSPPKPEEQELEIWSLPIIQRFLDVIEGHPFQDLFTITLLTGMRRSEITGLRWGGVDFEGNGLRVTGTLQRVTGMGLVEGPPKTKSSRRSIALGQKAMTILNRIRSKQLEMQLEYSDLYRNNAGYVFTDALGAPIDSDRVSKEFAKVIKKAMLPHIRFHDLRHCHASLLLADGTNIKAISERLGHSKVSTTLNIYSHLLPNIQAAAAEGLERQLARRGETALSEVP